VTSVGVNGCGRDEGSYQFGRTTIAPEAEGVYWVSVGRSQATPESVCASAVNIELSMNTPRSKAMKDMDEDDIIDGCVDVLREAFGG